MIELSPADADPKALRDAFACFPSGVVAVCAMIDGSPVGMEASSFTSVSLAPPLVSFCAQTASATWPRLRARPRLGISVLAEAHDSACVSLSRKTGDRFADVDWEATESGAVIVHGATAWLECDVHSEVPAGDHSIVLLQIRGMETTPGVPPLIFHGSRFRRLVALGRSA